MTHRRISVAVGWAVGSLVVLGLLGMGRPLSEAAGLDGERVNRIGTYDNRAIAIAYARSEFHDLSDKMAEYEVAKASGDSGRVAELEAWGAVNQRLLHFQGFGRYPVDDLLECVGDELPALAEELQLDAIVWLPSYTAEGVEVVDVTARLVELFGIGEQAAGMAMAACEHEPLSFEELIGMGPLD